MVDQFLGIKYKLDSSENFEEFMKALGVGWLTRKLGAAASPVIELTKKGDEYTLTSNSTFKDVTTKFVLGKEFDEETPDGRTVRATFTIDGNTIKEIQKDSEGKITTIDRVWSSDTVKMICKTGNITAIRIYKKYE